MPALLLLLALLDTSTKSTWIVTENGETIAAATLFVEANESRVEWRADAPHSSSTFVARDGRLWIRTTRGEIDMARISAITPAYAVAAALLDPLKEGQRRSGVTAKYTYDEKGATAVTVETVAGNKRWVARRTALCNLPPAHPFK